MLGIELVTVFPGFQSAFSTTATLWVCITFVHHATRSIKKFLEKPRHCNGIPCSHPAPFAPAGMFNRPQTARCALLRPAYSRPLAKVAGIFTLSGNPLQGTIRKNFKKLSRLQSRPPRSKPRLSRKPSAFGTQSTTS